MIVHKLIRKSVPFLAALSVCLFSTGVMAKSKDKPLMKTVGPQGELPVSHKTVVLDKKSIQQVRKKEYKAAILMHTSSDFSNALIAGVEDVFKQLNIKVVVNTDAEMDSNKQRTDVETALALNPDLIISLVIDPVSGAEAFRPAIKRGVKLVFISNLPIGYKHGRDYAGIVTDDLFGMGKAVAEQIAENLNGKGNVALMYHDANYYVTNQRDRAVKTVLKQNYPGIRILTEKGIANPNDGEMIASAIMMQNPTIQAIYAPWDSIAEGVVMAARASGRRDVKVFTMDLGASNALDLVKGGNMAGIVADLPFEMGQTLARMGAKSLLGQKTPPFVVVPAIKVNKKNIQEKWQESLNRPAPREVLKALKKRS